MDRIRRLVVMCAFALVGCADGPDSGGTSATSLASATAATTTSDPTGADESSEGPALPMTPDECFQEHLSTRGDNCDVSYCGGITSCVNPYPDCYTCSQQCYPPSCSTDAECQEQFGDLCPGVTWICDAYALGTGCTVDFGGGGSSSGGEDGSTGYATTTGGDCSSGDPFVCVGANLFDCATGETLDCEAECIAAGFSGVASPPCGVGTEGYDVCLCI